MVRKETEMSVKEILGAVGTLIWPIITILMTSIIIWYYIFKLIMSIF